MNDDRCFCGAEWVDEAEECAAGHGFGEADKLRVRAERAEARVAELEKVTEAALSVYRAWDRDLYYVNKMLALGITLRDAGYQLRPGPSVGPSHATEHADSKCIASGSLSTSDAPAPSKGMCKCGHDRLWHVGPLGVGLGSGPACHCGCECFDPRPSEAPTGPTCAFCARFIVPAIDAYTLLSDPKQHTFCTKSCAQAWLDGEMRPNDLKVETPCNCTGRCLAGGMSGMSAGAAGGGGKAFPDELTAPTAPDPRRCIGHEFARLCVHCGAPETEPETRTQEALPEVERFRTALTKLNEIRNSIVGVQGFNFSEHAYPMVAALNEAGFEGLPYPEARENVGTLIERANKAEARIAELEARTDKATPSVENPEEDEDLLGKALRYINIHHPVEEDDMWREHDAEVIALVELLRPARAPDVDYVTHACGAELVDRDARLDTSVCMLAVGHPDGHYDPRTRTSWSGRDSDSAKDGGE